MASYMQEMLSGVVAQDVRRAEIVFELVLAVCHEVNFLEDVFRTADAHNDTLATANLPALVRTFHRLGKDLYDAYVLLCPRVDEAHAEELLRENGILEASPVPHVAKFHK